MEYRLSKRGYLFSREIKGQGRWSFAKNPEGFKSRLSESRYKKWSIPEYGYDFSHYGFVEFLDEINKNIISISDWVNRTFGLPPIEGVGVGEQLSRVFYPVFIVFNTSLKIIQSIYLTKPYTYKLDTNIKWFVMRWEEEFFIRHVRPYENYYGLAVVFGDLGQRRELYKGQYYNEYIGYDFITRQQ